MQGQANHFRLMAGVRSDYGIQRYTDETKRLLGVLESQLSKTDYLVANKYSIADIASYCWVAFAEFIEIDLNQFSGVKRWVDRIAQREGVKRGMVVPPSDKTLDDKRKMFADMRQKMDAKQNTDKV